MYCRNCNNEIPEDSVFCPECGTKVEAASNGAGNVCANCGSPVGPDDLFCPECGSPVGQPDIAETDESGPEQDWSDWTGGTGTDQNGSSDGTPEPNDKKKLYLIISVIAVVVLGAAIVIFSMQGKKKDAEQTTAPAEAEEEQEETEEEVDIEALGKAADINGVDSPKCTLAGKMEGTALSFEDAQTVYAYDEDGKPQYLEDVGYVTIESDLDSVDLEDYDEREVEAVGQISVHGEQVILKLLKIETTDGPLYDETEGGIHRYEIVMKDCGWQQAYQESIQKGGYLVRVNSKEEYNYILRLISEGGYDKAHFYLGGRRDNGSQTYYWVDEENKTYGPALNNNAEVWCNGQWMAGEPSFSDPNLNIEEAYLNIFYYASENRWIWNDGPEDIPGVVSSLSGYVGYIVEYEDE